MSQPSLTRLQFKNWRSLREVEIEFDTPITVFIGANSSGKTNIVDGLEFLRHGSTQGNRGFLGSVRKWGGIAKIHTTGTLHSEALLLEVGIQAPGSIKPIRYSVQLDFEDGVEYPFFVKTVLAEAEAIIYETPRIEQPSSSPWFTEPYIRRGETIERNIALMAYRDAYLSQRLQILKEAFLPAYELSQLADPGDIYILEPMAGNLPFVLEFMRQTRQDLYDKLREDFSFLLDHVHDMNVERTDEKTRIAIYENLEKIAAPSVSMGTARILAMLTPFYLLDMDFSRLFDTDKITQANDLNMSIAEMPGLVVIEEPDTALNPGILARFVGQLREYTREKPRQIILTTHNPTFLNYFEPEEVRVVTRDEQGYTQVERVPDYVRELWLDEFTLGEVWMGNSFGGLAL